jgi:hypothetical protein
LIFSQHKKAPQQKLPRGHSLPSAKCSIDGNDDDADNTGEDAADSDGDARDSPEQRLALRLVSMSQPTQR